MSFEEKYKSIQRTVKEDFCRLEQGIVNLFREDTPLNVQLLSLLTAPAKRIRPLIGFLILRCAFGKITPTQHDVLFAVELIHNASLIHDDVIDDADKRRNRETLNSKFDDNLAVVAGDFLLSVAMEKVINTNSIDVLKLFVSAMQSTCLGEIDQYFSKYNVTSIDEYIEKSRQKTALLFQIGVSGGLLLADEKLSKDLNQAAIDFSQNFGIAFQIRDDLINILNSETLSNSDIDSGIYTAPVIFACLENENLFKDKNLLDAIKSTKGIEKAKDLMDNYFDQAICAIEKFDDNEYKNNIIELVEIFRESL